MDIAVILEGAAAGVGCLAVVYSAGKLGSKVEDNTRATEKLSSKLDTLDDTVTARLSDHETRITVLENWRIRR